MLRDNRGGFIRAATARLDHIPDVVSAEATTQLEGLQLAQGTGCNNLLVRMDNLIVVEALQNNEGHSTVAAPIIQDCRELMREFGKVVIEHCNRESNMVAHVLVQWGRSNPPSLWLEEPPDFIASSLADDVAVI